MVHQYRFEDAQGSGFRTLMRAPEAGKRYSCQSIDDLADFPTARPEGKTLSLLPGSLLPLFRDAEPECGCHMKPCGMHFADR